MPQPFGIGDVVGGRYRITHHVVTSADQDIIFQATDDLLGREVSVLLASRANAKQVATSAKELAIGERDSSVEVLDLGLAEDRTFLISTVVDPNQLLDLVVPDSAPYVEPYYTDSLGSELFGQSRQMEPQTYDDDAEYYARLQAGLGPKESERRRALRPAFLDRVTPAHRRDTPSSAPAEPEHSLQELESELESAGDVHGLNVSREISRVSFSLRSDLDEVGADPAADVEEEPIEAVYDWTSAGPAGEGRPLTSGTRADSDESVRATPGPAPAFASEEPSQAALAPQSEPEVQQEVSSFGASSVGGPFVESAPSAAISTVGVRAQGPSHPGLQVDELLAEGEEVVDDPPQEPVESYDRRSIPEPPVPQAAGNPATQQQDLGLEGGSAAAQEPSSFTTLISTVPSRTPTAFPAGSGGGEAAEPEILHLGTGADQDPSTPLSRWIALGTLAVLILAAAIIVFVLLTSS
ncbi:hypothetical protein [Nesterenkonia ebinurensis]|uniref:hypothetical protein n=1 Tax=Nesterenkonia ebinurensis TaxID=2608252 RepID=UPI00123CEF90|nr:hypothetical protein [Nesterenkonia ebinurensis]